MIKRTDLAYKYENGVKTDVVEDFYWKVLTDRRMYGNEGQYLPQKVVTLNDTTTDTVTSFAKNNYGRQYNKALSMQTAEKVSDEDWGIKKQAKKNRDNFVEDKYFKTQMRRWDRLAHGSYVKVGELMEDHPLVRVGMPQGTVRYDVDKLNKNMEKHTYLDEALLEAIPDIIANPIAISEYSEVNTVSVFGNIFVGNSPMMVGITISRDRSGTNISKVRTYNARRDVGKLITDETVLYLNEDKKRTRTWFQACGIQVPLGETKFGFIRSISQKASTVNRETKKTSDNDTTHKQQKTVSNRTILSNTLESAIDTSTQEGQNELKWLKKYQSMIALIEKEEAHLAELNAEL